MTTAKTDITEGECPGCGSDALDRRFYKEKHDDIRIELKLSPCSNCGVMKCCMCDLGMSTVCMSCDDGCPND